MRDQNLQPYLPGASHESAEARYVNFMTHRSRYWVICSCRRKFHCSTPKECKWEKRTYVWGRSSNICLLLSFEDLDQRTYGMSTGFCWFINFASQWRTRAGRNSAYIQLCGAELFLMCVARSRAGSRNGILTLQPSLWPRVHALGLIAGDIFHSVITAVPKWTMDLTDETVELAVSAIRATKG